MKGNVQSARAEAAIAVVASLRGERVLRIELCEALPLAMNETRVVREADNQEEDLRTRVLRCVRLLCVKPAFFRYGLSDRPQILQASYDFLASVAEDGENPADMVAELYHEVQELLAANQAVIEALADSLLEKEFLSGEEVRRIISA